MRNNKKIEYIKKHGKLKTIIIGCLATLIVGTAIGYGSSQIFIAITDIIDDGLSMSPRSNPSPSDNVDRSNLPDIFEYNSANAVNPTAPSSSPPPDGEYSGMELFAKMSDTVVGIKILRSGIIGEGMTDVIGSGVIISDDGFIITCAHVIDDAQKVMVVVDDYDDPTVQHEYEAKIYGSDVPTDLAVLKVERKDAFRFARIGNSATLKVGQNVAAIGNPLGLEKTMTKGIVSGLQRDLRENTYMLPSIQTDAALNPGNSGCPLFDMQGRIVGIVNIKLVYGSQPDNLGFAISINDAMPIIDDLMKHGYVTSRAMLGITAQEITSMNMRTLGVSVESGLYVETIRKGTPAAQSDLSRGDVITKIDGEKVATITDVQKIIKDKSVGDDVEVTIMRYDNQGDGKEMKLTFALASAG